MAQMKMYPVKDGSPQTTTITTLSDSAIVVSVAELACFPAVGAEGANLITLWNDTTYETCEYTAKSSASGLGTLNIVRSGARHSSTSGGGIEWPPGTKCARTGTGYDFTAIKNNIEDLVAIKQQATNELTAETIIAEDDFIPIYDKSAAAHRKIPRSHFLKGVPRINDIIGVKWNSASSSPTLTRVDEDLQEITSPYLGGWTKFFDSHAIWGQMWRCQLSAAGVPTVGTNPRGDGLTLTSDYIMTRVPRVYDKFVFDDGDWYWLVSPEPSSGFSLQPTFNQRGHSASPAKQIYVGSYDAHDAGSSKLGSKSGSTPLVSQTMATFESRGNNIGAGWGLMNFHTLCLLQMLFYIEYASFYSQSKVGPGYTNAANTGPLASGGAAAFERTNGTSVGTSNTQAVSWRGIENLWGNIWQFVIGYNTTDSSHRILKRNGTGTIADVLAAGSYEEITDPIPLNGTTRVSGVDAGTHCHGYVSGFDRDAGNILGPMFVPGALIGASDQYLTDYFYSHRSGISQTGVLLAGGTWNHGLIAGAGYRDSFSGPSSVGAGFGGRVECII